MKKFMMGVGIFFATVLFLSIQIGNRPIFGHIYKTISPATKYVQAGVENFFNKSFNKTHNYSKRLFDNSNPKMKDSVKSKMAASKRFNGEPAEKITTEEKEQLDELIKSHR